MKKIIKNVMRITLKGGFLEVDCVKKSFVDKKEIPLNAIYKTYEETYGMDRICIGIGPREVIASVKKLLRNKKIYYYRETLIIPKKLIDIKLISENGLLGESVLKILPNDDIGVNDII